MEIDEYNTDEVIKQRIILFERYAECRKHLLSKDGCLSSKSIKCTECQYDIPLHILDACDLISKFVRE